MSKIGLLHPDVTRFVDGVVNEVACRALIARKKIADCIQYFRTNDHAITEAAQLNRLNRYYDNMGFPDARD